MIFFFFSGLENAFVKIGEQKEPSCISAVLSAPGSDIKGLATRTNGIIPHFRERETRAQSEKAICTRTQCANGNAGTETQASWLPVR